MFTPCSENLYSHENVSVERYEKSAILEDPPDPPVYLNAFWVGDSQPKRQWKCFKKFAYGSREAVVQGAVARPIRLLESKETQHDRMERILT